MLTTATRQILLNRPHNTRWLIRQMRGIAGTPRLLFLPHPADLVTNNLRPDGRVWTRAVTSAGPGQGHTRLGNGCLVPYEAGVTNLVTNPSFEVDTAGWQNVSQAVISRSASGATSGSACGLITRTGSVNASGARTLVTPGAVAITFSADVTLVSGDTAGWRLRADVTADGSDRTDQAFTPTSSPQRVTLTKTLAGAVQYSFAFISLANSGDSVIRTDRVQVTVGATEYSYTDGSLGTGYAWTGVAHASTSTRAEQAITTPDTADLSFTSGPFSGIWFGNVTDSAAARGLIDKYSGSGSREYYFAVDSSDQLALRVCDATDANNCTRTSTASVTLGSPTLLGWSCSETASATAGNNVTLYEKGVVKASSAVNGAGYTAMTGTDSIARVGGSGNIGRMLGGQGFAAAWAADLTVAQHRALRDLVSEYAKVAL